MQKITRKSRVMVTYKTNYNIHLGLQYCEITIYVAAIDATAATIGGGGGGTQQGSEEGKNQSLRKEKRRCTIRRPRCTYPIFVCGHFFTRSTPLYNTILH